MPSRSPSAILRSVACTSALAARISSCCESTNDGVGMLEPTDIHTPGRIELSCPRLRDVFQWSSLSTKFICSAICLGSGSSTNSNSTTTGGKWANFIKAPDWSRKSRSFGRNKSATNARRFFFSTSSSAADFVAASCAADNLSASKCCALMFSRWYCAVFWRSCSSAEPDSSLVFSHAAAEPLFNATTNCLVTSRMSVSILPALTWMRSSPATPSATNAAPIKPTPNTTRLGFPGEWITPRAKSRQSCLYSIIRTNNSMATPTTTMNVKTFSHRSKAAQEVSRVSSSFARADASMRRFYDRSYRLDLID